jgi:peroxiredoxin
MSTALLAIGDVAPFFEAPASDGKTYTLARLIAAQAVVLVFYPGNNTPG